MKYQLRAVFVFIFSAGITCSLFAQQDPEYSMYMFNKMAINPATAGSKDAMEATIVSRLQWAGIPGAPQTNAFTLEAPFASQKVGWGIEVMNDNSGPITSNSIEGNYAYHLKLFKGQLALGLGLGIYDYDINFSKIQYKDGSDPMSTYGNSTKIVPNAAFGIYYYSNSFYFGASLNHLLHSKFTNSNAVDSAALSTHAYVIVGQGFQLSKNVLFSPSLIAKLAQNAPPSLDLNLDLLLQEKIWLGVGLRADYGFVFLAAFRASQSFQVGLAYDLGINGIGTAGGGTYELSLSIDFGKHKMVQMSPRYM